jgi:peroxiredoxin
MGVFSGTLSNSSTAYYRKVRQRVPASCVFYLLLPLVFFSGGCNRTDHPKQIGKIAPEFTVVGAQRTVNLQQYRGKVVVLNFWATWCAPCLEEIPSLDQLQRQVPDIVVLGVSTDEDKEAYRQFLAEHPVSFISVRDPSQHSNQLYGTVRFPETYIIDKKGFIRRKFIGPQEWTSPEILNYLSILDHEKG